REVAGRGAGVGVEIVEERLALHHEAAPGWRGRRGGGRGGRRRGVGGRRGDDHRRRRGRGRGGRAAGGQEERRAEDAFPPGDHATTVPPCSTSPNGPRS